MLCVIRKIFLQKPLVDILSPECSERGGLHIDEPRGFFSPYRDFIRSSRFGPSCFGVLLGNARGNV